MFHRPPNPLNRILAGARPSERIVFSAAIFCLFATMGLLTDVMRGGQQPAALLAANVIFAGSIALAYAWTAVHNPWLMVVPIAIHLVYTTMIVDVLPVGPALTDAAAQRVRLRIDAMGAALCMSLSYVFFLIFITRTGARHVAVQTEMALARDIHKVLVPPIGQTLGQFEFSGLSIPSGDVGGDLVDVVDLGDGAWMAYVADVSGHGVSSGLLMGMVKSAVRMRMRTDASAGELLTDLQRVLEPLMQSAMYVTVAMVTCDRHGRLAFSLAGHLPILRIRADGAVERIHLAQLPVGMMPGTQFAEAPLEVAAGDVLALVTDGLVEVFDRGDREFSLERVEAVLAGQRTQGLGSMASTLLAQVRGYGAQLDDQTLLLIRATGF